MQDPVTELDERFSDAGAEPTPWATTRAVLEQAQLSWVTTVRADGRPHATPLVAVWLDEAVHFTTGPSEQKAVNLVGNPHVVMTIGCTRWDEGLDVMIEGRPSASPTEPRSSGSPLPGPPNGTANGGSEWPTAASPTAWGGKDHAGAGGARPTPDLDVRDALEASRCTRSLTSILPTR